MKVDRLAVACGALGALVVLAAAFEGPTRISLPGGGPARAVLPPPPAPPVRTLRPPVAHGSLPGFMVVLLWIVVAVAVALVVVVLVVLLRRLRVRSLRGGRAGADLEQAPVVPAQAPVAAPVVRRGIARALEVLADDREPGDAVVRAWLGLEQTAADAGVQRRAAETPTEFTVRLLGRVAADRAAVRTLLELYLRARFAGRASEATDVQRARAALAELARSWTGAGADPPAHGSPAAPAPGQLVGRGDPGGR